MELIENVVYIVGHGNYYYGLLTFLLVNTDTMPSTIISFVLGPPLPIVTSNEVWYHWILRSHDHNVNHP